jgi:hypothetical protein
MSLRKAFLLGAALSFVLGMLVFHPHGWGGAFLRTAGLFALAASMIVFWQLADLLAHGSAILRRVEFVVPATIMAGFVLGTALVGQAYVAALVILPCASVGLVRLGAIGAHWAWRKIRERR